MLTGFHGEKEVGFYIWISSYTEILLIWPSHFNFHFSPEKGRRLNYETNDEQNQIKSIGKCATCNVIDCVFNWIWKPSKVKQHLNVDIINYYYFLFLFEMLCVPIKIYLSLCRSIKQRLLCVVRSAYCSIKLKLWTKQKIVAHFCSLSFALNENKFNLLITCTSINKKKQHLIQINSV